MLFKKLGNKCLLKTLTKIDFYSRNLFVKNVVQEIELVTFFEVSVADPLF